MQRAIRAVQKAISTVETAKMTADEVVRNEMYGHLLRLAEKTSKPGDKLKKIWGDLALATGLPYGQCKRIWKKEWKVIPGSVVRLLDSKLSELERKNDAAQETLRTRQEAIKGRSAIAGDYQARTATADRQADGMD